MKTVGEVWVHEPPAHQILINMLVEFILKCQADSLSECICISTLQQRDSNLSTPKSECNILEETMLELALWVKS